MKSFEYSAPKTVKEATALLSDNWGETEILAGGTDLVTSLKQELTSPKRVVSLKNVSDLRGIKADSKTLRIGAMTTLGELAANKDIQKHFPALVTAARNVSSPQILAHGTVGGRFMPTAAVLVLPEWLRALRQERGHLTSERWR